MMADILEYIQQGGMPLLLVIAITVILFINSLVAMLIRAVWLMVVQALGIVTLAVVGYWGYKHSETALRAALSGMEETADKAMARDLAMAGAISSFHVAVIACACLMVLLVFNLFFYRKSNQKQGEGNEGAL